MKVVVIVSLNNCNPSGKESKKLAEIVNKTAREATIEKICEQNLFVDLLNLLKEIYVNCNSEYEVLLNNVSTLSSFLKDARTCTLINCSYADLETFLHVLKKRENDLPHCELLEAYNVEQSRVLNRIPLSFFTGNGSREICPIIVEILESLPLPGYPLSKRKVEQLIGTLSTADRILLYGRPPSQVVRAIINASERFNGTSVHKIW